MATRTLEIVAKLKDEASKQMKNFESSLIRNKKGFQDMAKYGGLAFGAIVGGVGLAVRAYQEQEKAEARLTQIANQVIGATKEQIQGYKDLATQLQSVGVMGDEVVMSGQSQLASFTKNHEVVSLLSGDMADLAVATYGVNVSHEQAIQTSNILGKALQGQLGALTRTGILVSDEYAKAFKEANTEMERAEVLSKIVADNYGGLNEAMRKTGAGGIRAMRNGIGDLNESIGKIFAPLAVDVANKIQGLAKRLEEWVSRNEKLIKVITIVVAGLAGLIAAVGTIGLILPAVIKGFGLLTLGVKNLIVALKVLTANPIILFLTLIAGAIVYLSNKFGGLQNAFAVIGAGFITFGELGAIAMKTMVNQILKMINWIMKQATNLTNWFRKVLRKFGVEIENTEPREIQLFSTEDNWNKINEMGVLIEQLKQEQIEKEEEAMLDLNNLYLDDLNNFTEAVDGKGQKVEKMKTALESLGETFKGVMEDSQKAMEETAKKISDLQNQISDLFVGKAKDDLSMRQSYASEYVKQEERVADLRAKWQQETDQVKKDSLLSEYEYHKSLLDKKRNIELVYSKEINEVRRRNSLTEFERALEDLELKQTLLNQEFEAKYNKLQKELNAENEKFKALHQLQQWAVKEADRFLAHEEKQTLDSVNRRIAYYNRLAEAVRNASQGKSTSYASLASGTRSRMTSSDKPNVNITVNGDISGDELIDKVKTGIMGDLRMNSQISL